MLGSALPPLLKAELSPESAARIAAIEAGPYDPLWQAGEAAHAQVRPYAAGKLAVFEGPRPTGVSVPVVAYVLRAGDVTIAVDTGLASRWRGLEEGEVPDEPPGGGRRYRPVLDGPTFAEQLAEENVVPDFTVCTHLHLDHAGGARELGLHVHAAGAEMAVALSGRETGYPAADLDGLPITPFELDRGPAGPFPGHAELAPGVIAVATPGHTAGSISVFACLGRTWALVCGDAVYPPADAPGSEAYLGMLRIRRMLEEMPRTLVLAGHDTAVLRAAAGGAWFGGQ